MQTKVKVAQAVGLGSGTQRAPGIAPASDLANQRAIAAGLNPTKNTSKRMAIMSNENQENVSTEVKADSVETVNETHEPMQSTGLEAVDFKEEGIELESEESSGAKIDDEDTAFIADDIEDTDSSEEDEGLDEDAPDADEYETDEAELDEREVFEAGKYSALLPNYISQTVEPVLVVTFNLNSPELFDGLKDQLDNTEFEEGTLVNFWSPFQRAKTDNAPVPAYAKPLRLVVDYLNKLPEENLRIVAPELFGSQITEMLSTHTAQIVQWKLLNTHFDVSQLEVPGFLVDLGDDEEDMELLKFNELIDAEGYVSPQTREGDVYHTNNVINISLQVPSLYASRKPDVMATRLVNYVDKMRNGLPTVVSFAFNSDEAVTDPSIRLTLDALLEAGFTAVSRDSIENTLGEVAILPEEINPTSSEALDTLFLHGGDLLLVRSLDANDNESEID